MEHKQLVMPLDKDKQMVPLLVEVVSMEELLKQIIEVVEVVQDT